MPPTPKAVLRPGLGLWGIFYRHRASTQGVSARCQHLYRYLGKGRMVCRTPVISWGGSVLPPERLVSVVCCYDRAQHDTAVHVGQPSPRSRSPAPPPPPMYSGVHGRVGRNTGRSSVAALSVVVTTEAACEGNRRFPRIAGPPAKFSDTRSHTRTVTRVWTTVVGP